MRTVERVGSGEGGRERGKGRGEKTQSGENRMGCLRTKRECLLVLASKLVSSASGPKERKAGDQQQEKKKRMA